MAYAVTNPPVVAWQVHPTGMTMWYYATADSAATCDTSGYITDGVARGMRHFDHIMIQNTSTGVITVHVVLVTGTTVDLTDGVAFSSAANAD